MPKKELLFHAFFIFCQICGSLYGQKTEHTTYAFASKYERNQTSHRLRNTVDSLVGTKADPSTSEAAWNGVFWAMELMLYKPEKFDNLIPNFIKSLSKGSPEFQRSFLEMMYTLHPKKYNKLILKEWSTLANAKNQAMALEYLLISGIKPVISSAQKIYGTGWHEAYLRRLKPSDHKPKLSDFADLSFLPEKVILCSFQSSDRNIPGYVMIRKADGTWISDIDGKPLKISQLARSISNLPYYLTNGNTPQGLFKITGTDVSTNKWIGPTTNIQMLMPFENENNHFTADPDQKTSYTTLLGPKLSTFQALYESFEAGKLGRTEIITHGTSIDPTFYKDQKYYPCTPSLGCLCAPELWDDKGNIIYSAQQQLIDALKKYHLNPEWLIVSEISDFQPPPLLKK